MPRCAQILPMPVCRRRTAIDAGRSELGSVHVAEGIGPPETSASWPPIMSPATARVTGFAGVPVHLSGCGDALVD